MKVGDLVRIKTDYSRNRRCGIVISILVNDLVGVMWTGTEFVYAEPIKYLEVINKDDDTDAEWKVWGDQ